MKKTAKIIMILCLAMVLVAIATSVYATAKTGAAITPGQLTGTAPTDSGITDIGNKIVGVIQTVGVVVAVVIVLILGIKYMLGSAEEKAEYKKSMIPYIVGAVLIFAGSTLVNIIYNFVTGLNTK